jgi:hypothetical protein
MHGEPISFGGAASVVSVEAKLKRNESRLKRKFWEQISAHYGNFLGY